MSDHRANILDFRPSSLLRAVVTWLVPFVVSGLMYDPDTKGFLPNFAVFKIVMVTTLIAVTVPIYIWLKPSHRCSRSSIASTFLVVNIVLDIVVLVMVLKVPFLVWLLSILPIYLLVFYSLARLISIQDSQSPSSMP
jgi:uncharacterized membrane protein YdbT with pleckstrin-like domain